MKIKPLHLGIFVAIFLAIMGGVLLYHYYTQASPGNIPQKINYQGKLIDPTTGDPKPDGNYSMTFSIWDASSGGNKKWEEVRDGSPNPKVAVSGGLFHVELGAYTPITIPFTENYWLELVIEGETLSPRQQILSTGYSYNTIRVKDDPTYYVEPTAEPTSASFKGNILGLGTFGSGSIPHEGAGTKFFWYPKKAALRAGNVGGTQWDDANVGNYSTALGINTIASGEASFAAGTETTAGTNQSVAIGFQTQTTENGAMSFAMGNNAVVSGFNSVAMGQYVKAGNNSHIYVFGRGVNSDNPLVNNMQDSFMIGFNTTDSDPAFFVTGGAANTKASIGVRDTNRILTLRQGAGNAIADGWDIYSSREYKKDITYLQPSDYAGILQTLDKINVVRYHYKDEDENAKLKIGVIAEEAPKEIISEDDKSMSLSDSVGFLLAIVKAQQEKIEALEREIEELKK